MIWYCTGLFYGDPKSGEVTIPFSLLLYTVPPYVLWYFSIWYRGVKLRHCFWHMGGRFTKDGRPTQTVILEIALTNRH